MDGNRSRDGSCTQAGAFAGNALVTRTSVVNSFQCNEVLAACGTGAMLVMGFAGSRS